MSNHIYGKALRRVSMFRRAEDAFIVDLACQLNTATWGPMEYVFNENQPVDTMYVICKGRGRVQIEDWQGDVLHFEVTKGAGESFGHEFLMFKTDAYVAARTLEFSKFACLKRDKFKTV